MNATPRVGAITLALFGLLAPMTPAAAQDHGYVQASVFADTRQFGSATTTSGLVTEPFSRDATGIGGSLRVGTWLHPHWTLEAGVDADSRTTVDLDNPFDLPLFPSRLLPFDMKSSSRFTTVATLVGFHQQATRRLVDIEPGSASFGRPIAWTSRTSFFHRRCSPAICRLRLSISRRSSSAER
jgi:hypothetical protein